MGARIATENNKNMSRMLNLTTFETLVRVVTTAGTPVRLSPYQVGTTIAFNNNGVSADTITDSGSGFLNAGFQAGDWVTVAGSSSNNSTNGYEIATVVAGTITLVKNNILTTEVAGSSVTLETIQGFKVEDGVKVTVRARTANTGVICLAPTSARAVNTVSGYKRHSRIEANQSVGTQVKNLKDLWIDATVSGEGVEILLEK